MKNIWDKFWIESANDFEFPSDEIINLANKIKVFEYNRSNYKRRYKFLELGCGSGRDLLYLASNGYDVTGIDISSVAFKKLMLKARDNFVQPRVIIGDMFDCDNCFDYESFDIIFSVNTLNHFKKEDLIKLLGKVYKIMRKKGIFLFTLASEIKEDNKISKKVTNNNYSENIFHEHYDREQIVDSVSSFDLVKISLNDYYVNKRYSYWSIILSKLN